MSKIIFTRGIQGSGKSTWAKQWCIDHPDWVRINRDDIRNMRGQYWLPKDEGMISEMELELIISALESGKNVVIDAMNLNKERDIKGKLDAIRKRLNVNDPITIHHEVYDFTDVSLEECQRRNLIRPNSIDPAVIQRTWEKYLAPEPVVYKENNKLPHCIIVDVDGTLAKMEGRSPYDWDKVSTDRANLPVINMVNNCKDGRRIIVFTGRDGVCLQETEDWLNRNHVVYDEIFIRPEGNTEKDSIIKKRMFEENIRGKYYVDFVVDDRNQVVDMWRKELGLTCFQVDYGNF